MKQSSNIQLSLDFVSEIFRGINIPCFTLHPPYEDISHIDYGFRNILYKEFDIKYTLTKLLEKCENNTIYDFQSKFCCHYIFFRIPNMDSSFFIIGPFLFEPINSTELMQLVDKLKIPQELIPTLKEYFNRLVIINSHSFFYSTIQAMGKYVFGAYDNFQIQHMNYSQFQFEEDLEYNFSISNEINLETIEERYQSENALLDAVSQGNITAAVQAYTKFSSRQMPKRVDDSLRDKKNYAIILNSILRKAAETGLVHPLHLDSISSQFAYKIENASNIIQLDELSHEMVRKYCIIVKNHSLKGHSLLVQKILNLIDSDLKQDLTLKTVASHLNVNASYLSTLFKKETGKTLTDYVNSKRIKRAVFLLNSTTMQIQAIASEVGIPDLNYFTKVFKKVMGKTPREYRDMISY